MKKAIILVLFAIFFSTAFASTINVSYYMKNGFDSKGNLLPKFQESIDKTNATIAKNVPSFLRFFQEDKINLEVNDNGKTIVFGIKIKKMQIAEINKRGFPNAKTTVKTNTATLNEIANSKKPFETAIKLYKKGKIKITTSDWKIKFLLLMFRI